MNEKSNHIHTLSKVEKKCQNINTGVVSGGGGGGVKKEAVVGGVLQRGAAAAARNNDGFIHQPWSHLTSNQSRRTSPQATDFYKLEPRHDGGGVTLELLH